MRHSSLPLATSAHLGSKSSGRETIHSASFSEKRANAGAVSAPKEVEREWTYGWVGSRGMSAEK